MHMTTVFFGSPQGVLSEILTTRMIQMVHSVLIEYSPFECMLNIAYLRDNFCQISAGTVPCTDTGIDPRRQQQLPQSFRHDEISSTPSTLVTPQTDDSSRIPNPLYLVLILHQKA